MSFFNQSHPTNFRLDISDNKATEAFVLNATRAVIPSFRLTQAEVPSFHGLARHSIAGSSTEFDPLIVTVLVDEELKAYLDCYKWLLKINNYITGESLDLNQSCSNIHFHILDNNKKKIVLTVEYHDAWVTDIGELEYAYDEEGNTSIKCTMTFNYKYFTIEQNGKIIK